MLGFKEKIISELHFPYRSPKNVSMAKTLTVYRL